MISTGFVRRIGKNSRSESDHKSFEIAVEERIFNIAKKSITFMLSCGPVTSLKEMDPEKQEEMKKLYSNPDLKKK